MLSQEVNRQINSTIALIEDYTKEMRVKPDDTNQKAMQQIEKAINTAENNLLKMEFKGDTAITNYESFNKRLVTAHKELASQTKQQENLAKKDSSHLEKASELLVVVNAVRHLVTLMAELKWTAPVKKATEQDKKEKKKLKNEKVDENMQDDLKRSK